MTGLARNKGNRNSGEWWIATLFATNEIPSVMVTFVALVMLLQMGMGVSGATMCVAFLLLPWIAQPCMRRPAQILGTSRYWLHLTELLLTLMLMLFALTMRHGRWWTMFMLFGISSISAWHDLLARTYYMNRIGFEPARIRIGYGVARIRPVLRIFSSYMATVLTYGLMIMAVGVLQIYFRQRPVSYSWSLGCYILAGTYMFLSLINLLLFGNHERTVEQGAPCVQRTHGSGSRGIDRVWQMLILTLMLVPQGLMFYSRTVFLLATPENGGLGCTLQDIGFAQGTIGVISFLFGITLGLALQRQYGEKDTRWPLTICLGLSPLAYYVMTVWPPRGLWSLSAYTFIAQLLFGLGLNACRRITERISGERVLRGVNLLHIPVISTCLLLSMVASGFMLERMSFSSFFLVDALCAPLAWLMVFIIESFRKQ